MRYFSEILAEHIIKDNLTYSEVAKRFNVSEKLVYRQMKKLEYINPEQYNILKLVHKLNWYHRSVNGGKKTKKIIEERVKEEQPPHRNKEVLNNLYEELGAWEKVAEELGVSFRTVMRYK